MARQSRQKRPNECWYHGKRIAWINRNGRAHVQVKVLDLRAMKVALAWLEDREHQRILDQRNKAQ